MSSYKNKLVFDCCCYVIKGQPHWGQVVARRDTNRPQSGHGVSLGFVPDALRPRWVTTNEITMATGAATTILTMINSVSLTFPIRA